MSGAWLASSAALPVAIFLVARTARLGKDLDARGRKRLVAGTAAFSLGGALVAGAFAALEGSLALALPFQAALAILAARLLAGGGRKPKRGDEALENDGTAR